ncbi:D-alanyl-D-alanine carboxypeptidase family protein [Streptomyces olivoreticuli]
MVGLLCLVAIVCIQLLRPLPVPALTGPLSLERTLPGTAVSLPWPANGQASVAIEGYGTDSSPAQKPTPTASTAKVMTAYLFLRHHPLQTGSQGPSFAISAQEAARYPERARNGESLTPVTAGERFTERQALQAMMAVSANNIADEIARWCATDRAAFTIEMNQTAHDLGMNSTRYTDPSGLDPTTVSTSADQVKLLSAALQVPEFAAVAGSSYTEPSGIRHPNSNPLLEEQGVFAGKTGTTTAAGKNLVFAAHRDIASVSRLVVIAVMAQPLMSPVRSAAHALLTATDRSIVNAPVIRKGETITHLDDGWGRSLPLIATETVMASGRPGTTVVATLEPTAITSGATAGSPAAHATVTSPQPGATTLTLITKTPIPQPSLISRLTRRL